MLDRYDPLGGTMNLRQMMDRLLEDAVVAPRAPTGRHGAAVGPALDLYEEGDSFVAELSLPGVDPDDVEVSVEGGVLTVRGATGTDGDEPGGERPGRSYLVRERWAGRFGRSINLPGMVDPDGIRASYEQGVLRLELPKAEQARARRIPIGTGGQRAITGGQGPA
jgi:HSP20 family protein